MNKNVIADVIKATNMYYEIAGECLIDAYGFYRDISFSSNIMAGWLIDKDYASPEIIDDISGHAMDMIWEIMHDEPELIYVDKILNDVGLSGSFLFDESEIEYEDNVTVLICLLAAEANPILMISFENDLFGKKLNELRESIDDDEKIKEYVELMDSIEKRL